MKSVFYNSLIFSLFTIGQVFADTVYKCVTPDGKTVYQQTPCHTKNHKQEIELQEYPSTSEKAYRESKQSIKKMKKKADIQYIERKLKECDIRIRSLKKLKQKKVDSLRSFLLQQTETIKIEKIKGIIKSVQEDYQRRIDKKEKEKNQYKEQLDILAK